MKPAGPEGSGCMPISLDDEGLLFCVSYSPETATTVVSHALGTPIIEKKFVGTPHFVPGRELGIIARCTGGYADDRICLRQRGGVWTEVKPSTAVLRKWQPVFWLPRENGGVSLIVSEREVFEGEPKLALLDPQTNRVTPWDLPIAQLALDRESWRPLPGLTVLADGSVRGYTTNGSIAVDPHGHATLGTRKFVSVSSAAAHALARDEAEHLWQSSDWGAHWQEIAPPPFDETPEGSNAKVNPRPSGRATRIDCSLSGCALEHSSGLGSWIRLGFPEDPPAAKASLWASTPSTAVASVSTQPPQQLLSLSQPALPQLNCKSRSEGPLHATTLPAKLPEANAGEQWQAALAGGRALARRGKHTFANLEYRNVFADDQLFHQGLRATLHLQAEDTELKEMLGEKTPWDVRFVEPFDEQGRLRSFSASIQDWSAFGIATPGNASPQAKRLRELTESDFDHHQRDGGAARPLLSSEPGRAGGVLLLGELSLFARNNGIVPVRPGCYPVSGYLDGRGKGFVACGERDDYSTRIEALDAPLRDVFRAPPVTLSRDRERAGLHFFPPGESLLVNPDAIAVGRDGKFGLLRLPAGNAPPTADNPAWFLAAKSAPVALAPWSTLESASSPHCAKGDGYRAIVQTGKVWLDVLGAPDAGEGMTALVRWGTERVCLEAVEVGYDVIQAAGSRDLLVFAVARFAGARPGAGFVGTESAALQKPATCELAAPGFFPPRPREPRVAPPPAAQQRPRWDMRKPMY